MMVKKSKRLQLLVDLARKDENQAAQNLALAQSKLADDQQRLNDIKSYYDGYITKFEQATDIRSIHLHRAQSFLSHIDQACEAQAAQIKLSEHNVHTAKNQWIQVHLKVESMTAFKAKAIEQEYKEDDKKEQKLIDDLVKFRTKL